MNVKRPEFVGGSGAPFKIPKLPFPGLRGTGVAVAAIALVIVIALYFSFLEYVRPNEFGIKEIQLGLNRGIQEKVYGPGFALVIPKLQIIHRLPRNIQVLELTNTTGNEGRTAAKLSDAVRHTGPANIQTSDGFFVTVDATILYRISDPYELVSKLGPGDKYYTDGILPKAEPILKTALGQLTTEEFYNSTLRVAKSDEARDSLDLEMEKYGISVEHVLVRYFKYSDSIQVNIEEKKLQDQMVFMNQSKRKAAEAQQALNKTIAEGEKQVIVTLQGGQAFEVEKKAQQDLYMRTKKAEGDLLLKLAEAQTTEMRNEAMQVVGVDRKVALEMAEVLRGIEVLILPSGGEGSLNPLDLDSMVAMFGVKTAAEAQPASAPARGLARPPVLTVEPDDPVVGSRPMAGGIDEEVDR